MLNFVHIGIGQCGNRFAEQFGRNGKLALAINTARIDMSGLDNKAISPKNQIHIALQGNKDGAGRDPEIGRKSMEGNLESVYETIKKAVDNVPVDRFVLWVGLGGGTGTGGVLPLMKYLLDKGHKVMLGLTLPRKKEGWLVRMNAIKALTDIINALDADRRNVVPYVVIDNERFTGSIDSANETIVKDLTRFTKATNNVPAASAFDDTDFSRVLDYKGVMTLVRTTVPPEVIKGNDLFARSIQEAWQRSLYAKFEPEEATGAATLVIVPTKFYQQKGNKELITENIEGIEALYPHANPYSCIYEAKKDNVDRVIIYTMLTGLPAPDDTLDEIYEDVSEQIAEDRERRKERKREESQSRSKRKLFDYDPNNIDEDDGGEVDGILGKTDILDEEFVF